jgi:hypothetical protein
MSGRRDGELWVAAIGALAMIFVAGVVGIWFFMQAATRSQMAASRQMAAAESARMSAEAERSRAEVEAARTAAIELEQARSGALRDLLSGAEKDGAGGGEIGASGADGATPDPRRVSAREALDHAAADLDAGRLRETPGVEAELRERLGETYVSLGDLAAAEAQYTRALELRTLLNDEKHPDVVRTRARVEQIRTSREEAAKAGAPKEPS